MFSISTNVTSRVTHSEPGLPIGNVRGNRLKVTRYSAQFRVLFVLHWIELNNYDRCLTIKWVRQIGKTTRSAPVVSFPSTRDLGTKFARAKRVQFSYLHLFFASTWSSQLQDTDRRKYCGKEQEQRREMSSTLRELSSILHSKT